MSCCGPGQVIEGAVAFTVRTTSSVELAQGPLEMVQRRVVGDPARSPVTPLVGLEGVVTEPGPLTMDQAPVPNEGVLAARVAVPAHRVWSEPAFAVEGVWKTVMLCVVLQKPKV